MKLLLILLVSWSLVLVVNGAGFRYRADKHSGEKRLTIFFPNGGSTVLTDFEEKPYHGPKNLIDVNRPGESKKLIRGDKSLKASEKYEKDDSISKEEPKTNFIAFHDGEDAEVTERNQKYGILVQPQFPQPNSLEYDDGYNYPKPDTPFGPQPQPGDAGWSGPPISTTTRRPQHVGYPEVPSEENFGIGQNSEENKDILAGRPFRPVPEQEPALTTRRPPPIITTQKPGDDAAERFKPRPKSTQRPKQFCPEVDEDAGYNRGRPFPPDCIPRPTRRTTTPASDAAERFKPRPKTTTSKPNEFCPNQDDEDGYNRGGRPKQFPPDCIPKPTPPPNSDDAAERFKPKPRPKPTKEFCEDYDDDNGKPRPEDCKPRPTKPTTTTPPPADNAAERFKPKTTQKPKQFCPDENDPGYNRGTPRPQPPDCIPKPTRPTTPKPDSDAAERFKPREKPTPKPKEFCEDYDDDNGKSRPKDCKPRPITTTPPPADNAAERFKPKTTKPPKKFCTEREGPDEEGGSYPGVGGGSEDNDDCIPRPTTTTPANSDAAERFKPKPKTTQKPKEFCPAEGDNDGDKGGKDKEGKPRPKPPTDCIPRPTTPNPGSDDAAERGKGKPKPTTKPPDSDAAERFKPKPTTPPTTATSTTPNADAAERFKPRPKTTTPASDTAGVRPTRPKSTPKPGQELCSADIPEEERPPHCNPIAPPKDDAAERRKAKPKPTTPAPSDSDAAERFKPKPRPTPKPKEFCPDEDDFFNGKPRPTDCIPKPTRRPTTPLPCPGPTPGVDGKGIGYHPRRPDCPPPRETTPIPRDDGYLPPRPFFPKEFNRGWGQGQGQNIPTHTTFHFPTRRPFGNPGSFGQGLPQPIPATSPPIIAYVPGRHPLGSPQFIGSTQPQSYPRPSRRFRPRSSRRNPDQRSYGPGTHYGTDKIRVSIFTDDGNNGQYRSHQQQRPKHQQYHQLHPRHQQYHQQLPQQYHRSRDNVFQTAPNVPKRTQGRRRNIQPFRTTGRPAVVHYEQSILPGNNRRLHSDDEYIAAPTYVTNNRTRRDCGRDGRTEFFSKRLGRCIHRTTL